MTLFNDGDRAKLRLIAQTLVPPHRQGPSAIEAEVDTVQIDRLFGDRPDLQKPLESILKRFSGEDPRSFCETLTRSAPLDFQLLTHVVVSAFFLSDVARQWIGFDRIAGEFESTHPQPDYNEDGLLEPMYTRQASYRPTNWTPADPKETRE